MIAIPFRQSELYLSKTSERGKLWCCLSGTVWQFLDKKFMFFTVIREWSHFSPLPNEFRVFDKHLLLVGEVPCFHCEYPFDRKILSNFFHYTFNGHFLQVIRMAVKQILGLFAVKAEKLPDSVKKIYVRCKKSL